MTYFFKIFPDFLCRFKINAYLRTILKIIVTMTTIFSKRNLLRAMVWQAETHQCHTIRHRTPTARLFLIPKIYRYVTTNKCASVQRC